MAGAENRKANVSKVRRVEANTHISIGVNKKTGKTSMIAGQWLSLLNKVAMPLNNAIK